MPKVTQHQLDTKTASIIDVYQHLESQIFSDFVKRLKTHGIEDYDQTTVLQWQMEVMNDLKLVNDSVIDDVAKATGVARQRLIDLFQTAGYQVVDQEYGRASKGTKKPVKAEQVNMTHQVLDGYLAQTFQQLDNNVNQTLLTTNYNESPAMRTYQQIVKETTADVLAGLKTPDKALKDTIYKWRDKGINLNLIDKGGHAWSLESYARMVINTTTNRAFQAVRDQAASDNGIDTFVMSSHAASRPACAPIQGHLVTTRRQSFTAPESGEFFESLYDHGYGEPGGTFGINCHHIKWLYVPGASTNNQPQYNPQEAVEKGNVVQKQRELERRIRGYKNNLDLANQLNDELGQLKYKQLIHRNQAALRKLVKDHDFLSRDYARERSFGFSNKEAEAVKQRNTINPEVFNRHVPNTKEYSQHWQNTYNRNVRVAKRRGIDASLVRHEPPSEVTITSEKAQELVNRYGIRNLTTKQVSFEHTSTIGIFVDPVTGERIPTKWGLIIYRKHGAHIRPLDPRKGHTDGH